MDKKKRIILLELISHTTLTGKQLASLIMMSDRSLRYIIKELNSEISCFGAKITSHKSYGYKLVVDDQEKFLEFMKKIQTYDVIDESEDRLSQLFDVFMNAKNYVTIEDISNKLYLSTTLIKNILKELKEYLNIYHLNISIKPHYGMILEGSEMNKRDAIFDFQHSHNSLYYANDQKLNDEIEKILYSSFLNMNYQITDETLYNLRNLIYIMKQRISNNFIINIDISLIEKLMLEDEYHLAKHIMILISHLLEIEYIEEEVIFFTMYLCGNVKIIDSSPYINEDTFYLANKMIEEITQYSLISFNKDLNLQLAFALHLHYLEKRIQYKKYMKNPLTQKIKSYFLVAYDLALKACHIVNDYYNCSLSEDEIAFFALHINLSLEQTKQEKSKKNILLVCSTGIGSAQFLEYQLKSYFPNNIGKLKTCSLYELYSIDITEFHCILTTVPIDYEVHIPIIQIEHFIQKSDIPQLNMKLNHILETNVMQFFREDLFLVANEYPNKYEAIQSIVEKCNSLFDIPNQFYQEIINREKYSSTEFGELVAFPHPASPLTHQTFVAISILKKPLLWDKHKIRIIILCSVEKNKHQMLDHFYYVLSSFIMNQYWQWQLINNPTFENFKSIIQEIEKNV